MEVRAEEVHQGSLSDEEVKVLTDALERHYGDAIMPVREMCKRLSWFVEAQREGKKTERKIMPSSPYGPEARDALLTYGQQIITFAIKSNLLYRLLYLKQPLRTKKCPEHDGQWQGCFPDPCPHGCSVGADMTGWLPDE